MYHQALMGQCIYISIYYFLLTLLIYEIEHSIFNKLFDNYIDIFAKTEL